VQSRKRSPIPFWYADEIPGYQGDGPKQDVRKRLRRKDLAENFRVHVRTIDGWVKKRIIAAPHYLKSTQ
jgi:hypothetical protein